MAGLLRVADFSVWQSFQFSGLNDSYFFSVFWFEQFVFLSKEQDLFEQIFDEVLLRIVLLCALFSDSSFQIPDPNFGVWFVCRWSFCF